MGCWEVRCWAALQPAKGVALYDSVLRDWPRGQTRDCGLYLARLARACADAGELDRARAEGRRAFAIAQATQSSVATRELKHLTTTLSAQRRAHWRSSTSSSTLGAVIAEPSRADTKRIQSLRG